LTHPHLDKEMSLTRTALVAAIVFSTVAFGAEAPDAPKAAKPAFHTAFNGLLQVWLQGASDPAALSLRLRRSELKFSGGFTAFEPASFTVMVDPSKGLSLKASTDPATGDLAAVSVNQASRMLQDAFITMNLGPVSIDAGQFKLPLSMEGMGSSAKLVNVERTLFGSDRGRGGTYGDVRDLGVMARGKAAGQVEYWAGLFNGLADAQGAIDPNLDKAAVARVAWHLPWVEGLQLGSSGGVDLAPAAGATRRFRLGGEVKYTHAGLLLVGELMWGSDPGAHRLGAYARVGYMVLPKLQLAAGVDSWDPDVDRETNATDGLERDYTLTATWLFLDHDAQLQFTGTVKTLPLVDPRVRVVGQLNLQAHW